MPARAGAVRLPEPLKDQGQVAGGDADSRVFDRDGDAPAALRRQHGHALPGGRELGGVRQDVPQDLQEPIAVPSHGQPGRHRPGDLHALHLERRPGRLDGLEDDLVHVDEVDRQLQPARDDARRLQDAIDQPRQRVRVALQRVERPRAVLGADLPAQEPRVAKHDVHGGPQLMREHREELVLHPVGLVGDLAEPLVLGDVAGDFRGPDHRARCVPNRRHRQIDVDQRSVLALSPGLEVADSQASPDLRQDVRFFRQPIVRQDDADVAADRLLGSKAVHVHGRPVPGSDHARPDPC